MALIFHFFLSPLLWWNNLRIKHKCYFTKKRENSQNNCIFLWVSPFSEILIILADQ